MKKLLIATDLSARSDRALQRAIALAAAQDAELEIANVVSSDLPAAVIKPAVEAAASELAAQVVALPTAKQVHHRTRVLCGSGFETILRRAEEIGASLIVIGIHRHATRLMFRGTMAERLIRLGPLPVLVVREPVFQHYMRVLLALDLCAHSRSALEMALSLAPQARFQLVHALHVPFKSRLGEETVKEITRDEVAKIEGRVESDISAITARRGMPFPSWELIAREGLPQAVVRERAAHFKPDLIAIGTHGRQGVARALLGSFAEDMLANPPADVLVGRAPPSGAMS